MDDFKFGDARDNPASNNPIDADEAKRKTEDRYPFDLWDVPSAPGRDGSDCPGGKEGCEVFAARCSHNECDARIAVQAKNEDVEQLGRQILWRYVWRGAYDHGWERDDGDWYCDEHLRDRSC